MTTLAVTRAAVRLWQAQVLVCVAGGKDDLLLMRQAWSWAGRLDAALTVLHVLPGGAAGPHEQTIAADRTFAAALGAPLVELPAFSVLDGIAEFAAERGATHLVLSEPRGGQRRPLQRTPLSRALAARLPGIEVLIFRRPGARAEV